MATRSDIAMNMSNLIIRQVVKKPKMEPDSGQVYLKIKAQLSTTRFSILNKFGKPGCFFKTSLTLVFLVLSKLLS